ncbi:MAG: 23S rRNA pseudouridine(1911/1915/1917) synthase RluD [Pseudomonadota bacterium]
MGQLIEQQAEVGPAQAGLRLDAAAALLFPGFSRSRLQAWIKGGQLRLDGQTARPRDKVEPGAKLTLSAETEPEVSWQAESIALDIVFEDDSIIVVNKPAGLVVHPAAGHARGTLVNALINHAPAMAELPRGGIVHRLDKETSGIMVAAKSLAAHSSLVSQLQERLVSRQYCAICIGAMTGGGTVDEPIGRHPRQRKKMAVLPLGGKTAITHYQVAQRFGHHTRIAVRLETGRTHQIRVHMAHRHYPLIGDPVYGGRPRIPAGATQALIDALRTFPRQALHAAVLGLEHPLSGDFLEFECPLPNDIENLLAVLASDDPPAGKQRVD